MFMSLFINAMPAMQDGVLNPPAIIQTAITKEPKPDMVFDHGCETVQTPDNPREWELQIIRPTNAIFHYFETILRKPIDVSKAKISVLKTTKHGELTPLAIADAIKMRLGITPQDSPPLYTYRPNKGYLGSDDATFVVELDNKRYKVHSKYYVVKQLNDNEFYGSGTPATNCARSQSKRVASFTIGDHNPILDWSNIVESIASTTGSFAINEYMSAASGVTLSFENLPGTAVGETTSTGSTATITLDTNAAGHGWFIDSTPSDNSEYLPTSDANVWIAKAGSGAEGKMDMLSVLLHEYGHALGFEHSANTADFMSTSLVAGEKNQRIKGVSDDFFQE